jgi:hypothetical protein
MKQVDYVLFLKITCSLFKTTVLKNFKAEYNFVRDIFVFLY